MESLRQKLVEARNFQDVNNELNMQIDQCKSFERNLHASEERCKRYQKELVELRETRTKYEEQQKTMSQMQTSVDKQQTKILKLEKELRSYERLQEEFNAMSTKYDAKQNEFLQLVDKKSAMEVQLIFLQQDYGRLRQQFKEEAEELEGQNAYKDTQINLLNAQLTNLGDENKQIVSFFV